MCKCDYVDVTDEMIEAGFKVLLASGLADAPLEADRLVVVEIFQAMFAKIRPSDAQTLEE